MTWTGLRSTVGSLFLSILLIGCFSVAQISLAADTGAVGVNSRFGPYSLVSVADGDTITVRSKSGKYLKLRLIGLDAPEIAHGSRSAECGGTAAFAHMKSLLGKSPLYLEPDASQDAYDKYKRRLVYVYADNVLVNSSMISDGYAYEYTYKTPHKYQSTFRKLQSNAETEKRGIWNLSCISNNSSNRTKRFE